MSAGLAVLGAGIAATSNLTDSLIQWKSQIDTNKLNESLTRENWVREDNAVQRRVKDLISAGLSPTLAAGSAAASSSPMRMESPGKNFRTNLGDAFMTGMSIKQMSTQMENVEADTNNKNQYGQLLFEQTQKTRKEQLIMDYDMDLKKLNIVGQDLTNKERLQAIENLQKDYIMKQKLIENQTIMNQQHQLNYDKDKYDSDYMFKNFGTYSLKHPLVSDLAHLFNGGTKKFEDYFKEMFDDQKPWYRRIF